MDFELGDWTKLLPPEVIEPAIRPVLRQWGERVISEAKKRVPVDYGVLRASGMAEVVRDVDAMILRLTFGGAATPYALYVREGTGPAVGRPAYMPPSDVLEAWARRHGLPKGIGFILARAIGRRGTKPTKFLEAPVLEMQADLESELSVALERAFARQ